MVETYARPRFGEPREPVNRVNPGSRLKRVIDFVTASQLRSIAFLRNSDEFVFDQQIFAQVIARDARVVEIPIPTRYFREASSVDFVTSVRYARKTIWVLGRFLAHRRGVRWTLLCDPAAWRGPGRG